MEWERLDDGVGKFKMGKRIVMNWGGYGALIFCLCTLACGQEKQVPAKRGPIAVKIMEVSAESLAPTRTRSFLGTISSEHSAKLAFEVGGRITEMLVEEGAFVEKGTLLASLDSADYATAVDTLRTSVKTAKLDHSRSSVLAAQGAESRARVETAKLRMDTAGGQLTSAKLRLAHTRLIAPFSGYIGRRLKDVSDSVVAKQPVLILQDVSARRIQALIPEKDIALSQHFMPLQEGSQVVDARPQLKGVHRLASARPRVVLSVFPDREFPCEFVALTTAADPITRSLTMTMRFAPPDDIPVISGTSAKLLLDVPNEQKGLVTIPSTALIAGENDTQSVWLIDTEGRIAAKAVRSGQVAGEKVQVGGLEVGDRLVVSGVNRLHSGDHVKAFER